MRESTEPFGRVDAGQRDEARRPPSARRTSWTWGHKPKEGGAMRAAATATAALRLVASPSRCAGTRRRQRASAAAHESAARKVTRRGRFWRCGRERSALIFRDGSFDPFAFSAAAAGTAASTERAAGRASGPLAAPPRASLCARQAAAHRPARAAASPLSSPCAARSLSSRPRPLGRTGMRAADAASFHARSSPDVCTFGNPARRSGAMRTHLMALQRGGRARA